MRGILDIFAKWRNILHKSKEQAGVVIYDSDSNRVSFYYHFDTSGRLQFEYSLEDGSIYREVIEDATEGTIDIPDLPSVPTVKIISDVETLYLNMSEAVLFDSKKLKNLYITGEPSVVDLRDTSVENLVLPWGVVQSLNLSGLNIVDLNVAYDQPSVCREIWFEARNMFPAAAIAQMISTSPAGGTVHLHAGDPYNEDVIAAAHDNGWHVIQSL